MSGISRIRPKSLFAPYRCVSQPARTRNGGCYRMIPKSTSPTPIGERNWFSEKIMRMQDVRDALRSNLMDWALRRFHEHKQ